MKILIAPDKFKGALSAADAANAIAAGVRDARPDAEIELCPMGDGGEGTGRILAERGGFETRIALVLDPLGRPTTARWWCKPAERAAIVELAEASGIGLLAAHELAPLWTTTFGTGQLIRAALDGGLTAITLCVGGSATVDGGSGCVQALGCDVRDQRGQPIAAPLTGGMLHDVGSAARADSLRFGLRILCDVDNPLLGPGGAAAVFGPQKGAMPRDIQTLETNLAHWADVLEASTGRDVRAIPHGGASGGVPAGLHAVYNAALTPGAMAVAGDLRLFDRLERCDLCLTGEGRLDEQTRHGKVITAVAKLAGAQRVPTVALVGDARVSSPSSIADVATELGLAEVCVISPPGQPINVALAQTAANLRRRTAAFVGEFAARV